MGLHDTEHADATAAHAAAVHRADTGPAAVAAACTAAP
jgi:hypothetical protein